jgi:hypothetical protein
MAARTGSKHHAAKMTDATVRAARKAFAEASWVMVDGKRHPVNTSTLARKYGVTHQTMRAILTGKTWRHVS